MQSGIYQISSPSGGFYIGSAVNVTARWYKHKNDLKKGRHHSEPLQRAYAKYGMEKLEFFRLITCRPADLLMYEQLAIDAMMPRYNSCPHAGSQLGYRHSAATRAKLSASSPRRPPSEDQRQKTAASNRSRVWTAESREKLAARQRGGRGSPGKRSKEFCERRSNFMKGKKPQNCFENSVTNTQRAEIYDLYASGRGLRYLKKKYHTKSDVIRRILTDAGIAIRGSGRPERLKRKSR